MNSKPILFVGEKRSNKAVQMNVKWEDGKLAAKQLFDALKECGINPSECTFTNWFEYGGKSTVQRWGGIIVAMGQKVSKSLTSKGIQHISIIHPAARGKIRKKSRYIKHIKESIGHLGSKRFK